MRITDRFVVEHQVFLRQLVLLEEALGEPSETLLPTLRAIGRTLSSPLEAHREGEEGLLFPALGLDMGAVPVLVAEHEEIHADLFALTSGQDALRARRAAEHLIDLLREHIAKEDDLVFPLAVDVLGSERLEQLDRSYAVVGAMG
jgi:hemerythrin-like domain-containing protein